MCLSRLPLVSASYFFPFFFLTLPSSSPLPRLFLLLAPRPPSLLPAQAIEEMKKEQEDFEAKGQEEAGKLVGLRDEGVELRKQGDRYVALSKTVNDLFAADKKTGKQVKEKDDVVKATEGITKEWIDATMEEAVRLHVMLHVILVLEGFSGLPCPCGILYLCTMLTQLIHLSHLHFPVRSSPSYFLRPSSLLLRSCLALAALVHSVRATIKGNGESGCGCLVP